MSRDRPEIPLVAFSFYLAGRVNVLLSFADEIVDHLDAGFSTARVDGGRVDRAESLMWLWILGAYEVVRTMCQARACFSDRALDELLRLKRALAVVRMPAAKMEKAGRDEPVTSNRSPSGWDVRNRDLLMSDPDARPDVSARSLLTEFDRVISSIAVGDILASHEDSYESPL
jgi:hypothetical protein